MYYIILVNGKRMILEQINYDVFIKFLESYRETDKYIVVKNKKLK